MVVAVIAAGAAYQVKAVEVLVVAVAVVVGVGM